MAKTEWLDYVVDTDKDYYHNEEDLKKLPLDEMAIQMLYCLSDYQKKLDTVAYAYPHLYQAVKNQFKDYYRYCTEVIESKSLEIDDKLFEVTEAIEENLIDCHGSLIDKRKQILYDVDEKYELDSSSTFKVSRPLKKDQRKEFIDRVMARLLVSFPTMKDVLTTKSFLDEEDYKKVINAVENARLVKKIDEYATLYDKALRLEDMQNVLDGYSYRADLMNTKELTQDLHYYDYKTFTKAYTMQVFSGEYLRSKNLLTMLVHMIVDYDFLLSATKLDIAFNPIINKDMPFFVGENEYARITRSIKKYNEMQEYLLPLMQSPYYSAFNLVNFKDHTVFWKLDSLVEALIDYLYSPVNEKVVRFHTVESRLKAFTTLTYPLFMRRHHPKEAENLKIRKLDKKTANSQNGFLEKREEVQQALEGAGLTIPQLLEKEKQTALEQ